MALQPIQLSVDDTDMPQPEKARTRVNTPLSVSLVPAQHWLDGTVHLLCSDPLHCSPPVTAEGCL